MAFPRIDFQLTDEQLELLKPFQQMIRDGNGSSVCAEVFLLDDDYRYREARVRWADHVATRAISRAMVDAQDDFDKRRAKTKRLEGLREMMAPRISAVINPDSLTIKYDGHEYELRESTALPNQER